MHIKNESNFNEVIWYDPISHDNLNPDLIYNISVAQANTCMLTRTLQVIFELTNEEENIKEYILQDYIINSSEYCQFVEFMYSACCKEIIEVDATDFELFSCWGKIIHTENGIKIDYSSLEPEFTPISTFHYTLYQEH